MGLLESRPFACALRGGPHVERWTIGTFGTIGIDVGPFDREQLAFRMRMVTAST